MWTAFIRPTPEWWTGKTPDRITADEMLEMSSMGSKVLQIRSVEFAGKYKVPLRVLSSFEEGPEHLLRLRRMPPWKHSVIAGIASIATRPN
ncbi:MAG: hypothetical protein CM15mP103_11300 [Gammaproteobacteria bacterium]|nr:MAG: hypothetical protein CM15mP103_11300 [Gammaproteobacteria bacterium]